MANHTWRVTLRIQLMETSMSGLRPSTLLLVALSSALALGCASTSNDIEQAGDTTGEALNTAAEKTGEALSDAWEATSNATQSAADSVSDAVDDD